MTTRTKQSFTRLLFEKGDKYAGTKDRCRLTLRERDHEFFDTNVLRNPKPRRVGQAIGGAGIARPAKENRHQLLSTSGVG